MYERDGVEYRSYGEYLRCKGLMVGYCRSAAGWDRSKQKAWDSELAAYRSARDQGIQPASTRRPYIDHAVEMSQRTQKPFQAGEPDISWED